MLRLCPSGVVLSVENFHIFDFGLVKLGITLGDVAARVASLQTGNPYDLRCFDSFETPWAVEVEHFMHRTHARNMFRNEWMLCSRGSIATLVDEAEAAAWRIGVRNGKEQRYSQETSSGVTRPASSEDRRLHHHARELMATLVPARLRLEIAESLLKAATGATRGIPGIVRVTLVPTRPRFSAAMAEYLFPLLAKQCTIDKIAGAFLWIGVPRRSDFKAESSLAQEARRELLSRRMTCGRLRFLSSMDGPNGPLFSSSGTRTSFGHADREPA